MNYDEQTFFSKMVEFLDYLNQDGDSFPTMQNDVFFSDSRSMAHFFYNNTKNIEKWLKNNLLFQTELNGIDYSRARDILITRITLITWKRELSMIKFHKKTLVRTIK